MFQGEALSSHKLKDFWINLPTLEIKKDIIEKYEIRLLEHVAKTWNLTYSIMFPMDDLLQGASPRDYVNLNVSHTYWDTLYILGYRLLK